ncbi:uncharacterized protein STEHIDRAFT_173181 [Stereum hirsutum FP-91666 SS1]|uniref:Fatty acid hydroxylase domain-containing protein n=1 Tax=Stereum hirsutum (strain FP-91666) TaxID=721885 RepID=R7RWY0_STEHR|nr:uncharacterized protein STEHIDRAFT_173181 [Stereum hirsutum FP-91666 SS1]EIM79318.1 hypothetical protein STEHIDRAFT_173181 [Stereum hirsutum FP-91666 SS1]
MASIFANSSVVASSDFASVKTIPAGLPLISNVTNLLPTPLLRGIAFGILLSIAPMLYAETIYQVTRLMYQAGHLKRYYPLPKDRNYSSVYATVLSFVVPCTVYGHVVTQGPWIWEVPSFTSITLSTIGYMLMHDWFFYQGHRFFHANKWFYKMLHEAHHEYSHAMNVFVVGYAEMMENFIMVGWPWLFWTVVIHHYGNQNLAILAPPLSITAFTTLIGHSGYKYHVSFAMFHPLIIPFLVPGMSKYMLTPGDHQVHHSHRRFNFGLFFRMWDYNYGSYKKCEVWARDVHYWRKFVAENPDYKTNKAKVGFNLAETEWGF